MEENSLVHEIDGPGGFGWNAGAGGPGAAASQGLSPHRQRWQQCALAMWQRPAISAGSHACSRVHGHPQHAHGLGLRQLQERAGSGHAACMGQPRASIGGGGGALGQRHGSGNNSSRQAALPCPAMPAAAFWQQSRPPTAASSRAGHPPTWRRSRPPAAASPASCPRWAMGTQRGRRRPSRARWGSAAAAAGWGAGPRGRGGLGGRCSRRRGTAARPRWRGGGPTGRG